MSKDIFKDWKNNRFILPGKAISDEAVLMIILTDIQFWADNYTDLVEWCQNNNCKAQGMSVEFPDESTLLAFTLKWSS